MKQHTTTSSSLKEQLIPGQVNKAQRKTGRITLLNVNTSLLCIFSLFMIFSVLVFLQSDKYLENQHYFIRRERRT